MLKRRPLAIGLDSSTSNVVDTIVDDNVDARIGGLVGRNLSELELLGHDDVGCAGVRV